MSLKDPVKIALIGTGHRSKTVYKPLLQALKPWVEVVAVCDPVRESADSFAEEIGVPAFYDLKELVRARPMEAAFVVTPIPSHHSISCYLLSHGIHANVETSMSSLLLQAQDMVQTAQKHNTILRIGENFFRFPFDRVMKAVADSGFIGPVKRLTCWHDHTGYHNNSRWISFFGAHPVAVQAISHTMPTAPHYEQPHRYYEHETYHAHFYWFPDGSMVIDHAGNIKSMLGRYPRPGYTELAGARGSIVQQAAQDWLGNGEVRYCSDESLKAGAVADSTYPIVHEVADNDWIRSYVDLPTGRVEYTNPHHYAGENYYERALRRYYYGPAVMGHLVDFAETIRGVKTDGYNDQDALMAMMMEVATRESAIQDGRRLTLPLEGDLESEQKLREAQKKQYGIDPMDIEGMLAISYPRP
jgi:predicted dehydrogenase